MLSFKIAILQDGKLCTMIVSLLLKEAYVSMARSIHICCTSYLLYMLMLRYIVEVHVL